MSPNLKAFLETIAWSELGDKLLAVSDRGYNVCVGSTPAKPILFRSYGQHPMIRCAALNSDAAGRPSFFPVNNGTVLVYHSNNSLVELFV